MLQLTIKCVISKKMLHFIKCDSVYGYVVFCSYLCTRARNWREFAKCRFAHFPSFFSVHVDTYDMSVWWRHNLSLERKSQTCAFVFEHRSKLTRCYKQLDFIVAVLGIFFGISASGKGGTRLRRRKTYYLDQMDHSVRPS